ncbi:MAG: TlpA family protein disulfide reductase [Acidimicrobiia bacterium]
MLALAAVAVFATIRADNSATVKTSIAGVATKGSRAPDFDLAALRGPGRVKRSQFAGKPLIVNFWASWCVPCRKEFPTFRAAQAKYRAKGLAIVGINFKDLTGDARRFAKQQRATWTLAKGGDGDPVARAYGVRAIPQTFFIDRNGTIVSRFYGAPSGAGMDAEIQRIIGP